RPLALPSSGAPPGKGRGPEPPGHPERGGDTFAALLGAEARTAPAEGNTDQGPDVAQVEEGAAVAAGAEGSLPSPVDVAPTATAARVDVPQPPAEPPLPDA